jgi:hypothetical protein
VFDIPAIPRFRRIAEDGGPSCEAVRRLLQETPEHQRKEFEVFLQDHSQNAIQRGNRYHSEPGDRSARVIFCDGFEVLQKTRDGDYWIVPIPIVGTFK